MQLSILIPTILKRRHMLDRLKLELLTQIADSEVELLTDPGIGTVGAKRQRLLKQAKGEYVVFIDDDDWVSEDYISSILAAIELKPDVIGMNGWITTNGLYKKKFTLSKNCEYKDNGTYYERFNNHLCPVRREIALQIGFKDMGFGEDYDYALRLKNSGLIKEEVFISKDLYHYKFISRKSYS